MFHFEATKHAVSVIKKKLNFRWKTYRGVQFCNRVWRPYFRYCWCRSFLFSTWSHNIIHSREKQSGMYFEFLFSLLSIRNEKKPTYRLVLIPHFYLMKITIKILEYLVHMFYWFLCLYQLCFKLCISRFV